jgi:hypothetical protein
VTRIFTPLALFSTLLMLATLGVGFRLQSGNIRDPSDQDTQRWATVHRLSGIGAGLGIVLVNSIAMTYFIGTGRWCKEVVDTYALDPQLIRRSTKLKRRCFPVAVASMLTVLGIIALGGAADPGAGLMAVWKLQPPGQWTWANLHFLVAGVGLCFIVYAFVLVWNVIHDNQTLIADIMAEVKRVRAERGLDS